VEGTVRVPSSSETFVFTRLHEVTTRKKIILNLAHCANQECHRGTLLDEITLEFEGGFSPKKPVKIM
jgi:hypothetical protein